MAFYVRIEWFSVEYGMCMSGVCVIVPLLIGFDKLPLCLWCLKWKTLEWKTYSLFLYIRNENKTKSGDMYVTVFSISHICKKKKAITPSLALFICTIFESNLCASELNCNCPMLSLSSLQRIYCQWTASLPNGRTRVGTSLRHSISNNRLVCVSFFWSLIQSSISFFQIISGLPWMSNPPLSVN